MRKYGWSNGGSIIWLVIDMNDEMMAIMYLTVLIKVGCMMQTNTHGLF